MPKIAITPELIEIIYSERKKRNIVGTQLSKKLKKNTSFISNLEKGDIKYLDVDLFYNILINIIDLPEKERDTYIYDIIEKQTIKSTRKEILEQEWMLTFDMQKRLFPLTDKMIEIIKSLREEVGLTQEQLIEEINKNKGLEDDIVPNKLKLIIQNGDIIGHSIKFNLESDFIKKIEDKVIEEINYINLLGILYNLHLLKDINSYDATILAEKILNENGIYTLADRNKEIERKAQEKAEKGESYKFYELDPSIYGKEVGELLYNINSIFRRIRDSDIKFAYNRIKQFNMNLNECLGLMFSIIGFEFNKLKPIGKEKQKEFLNEVKILIDKYSKNESELDFFDID